MGSSEVPLSFREGGPDFLSSYVRDKIYGDSLEERGIYDLSRNSNYRAFVNLDTIQKLIDRLCSEGFSTFADSELFICNFYMGENLGFQLYNALGEDPFRSVSAELYILSQVEDRQITEEAIYTAFLRQTNSGTVDTFKEVYAELHADPIPG